MSREMFKTLYLHKLLLSFGCLYLPTCIHAFHPSCMASYLLSLLSAIIARHNFNSYDHLVNHLMHFLYFAPPPSLPLPLSHKSRELIDLASVMEELNLGPNGGLVYCMEYLLDNLDWLIEKIEVTKCSECIN